MGDVIYTRPPRIWTLRVQEKSIVRDCKYDSQDPILWGNLQLEPKVCFRPTNHHLSCLNRQFISENNNVRNWSNNSFVYYMVVCETFIVLFAGYSCPNFPSFELSEFWKLQTLETKPSKKSQHFPIQTFAKPHIQTWVALIYFRTLRKWSAIFGQSFSAWCWLPRRAWPP